MSQVTFKNSRVLGQRKSFLRTDRQQGWTMWSLMFVLGVLVFFSYKSVVLVLLNQ